jgi:hypothetical protein
MEGFIPVRRRKFRVEVHAFHLIALCMKDFLRQENLEQNRHIEQWLQGLAKIKVTGWGKWADMTRRVILPEAFPVVRAALDRPLTEPELLFLAVQVDEFIDMFAMGLMKKL